MKTLAHGILPIEKIPEKPARAYSPKGWSMTAIFAPLGSYGMSVLILQGSSEGSGSAALMPLSNVFALLLQFVGGLLGMIAVVKAFRERESRAIIAAAVVVSYILFLVCTEQIHIG